MRFDYLATSIDPVVDGLEDHETIVALEQRQYIPIRTLPGEGGNSRIYRCELTEEQRKMVSEGADVLVEILTFGGPMAPSRVMLLNQKDVPESERDFFKTWFAYQTGGPYVKKI